MYITDGLSTYMEETHKPEHHPARPTTTLPMQTTSAKDTNFLLQPPNRPQIGTRSLSGGFFGNLYQSLSTRPIPQSEPLSRSSSTSSWSSAPSSASSSPASTAPAAQQKKWSEIPKATWAGPSEGEVCLPPAWS